MKRLFTFAAVIFAVVLAALSTAACGKDTFDASRYVGAMLDAVYKGQYAEYVKMELGGDKSEEQAEKLHNDNISGLVDSLKETVGFDINEETEKKLTDTISELCSKVDYTVGERKTEGDQLIVPVSLRALNFSAAFDSEEFNAEAEKAVKETMKSSSEVSSEELNNVLMDLFIQRIEEINQNPTYSEKETIEVKLQKNKDDLYEIPYKTMQEIDKKLIR